MVLIDDLDGGRLRRLLDRSRLFCADRSGQPWESSDENEGESAVRGIDLDPERRDSREGTNMRTEDPTVHTMRLGSPMKRQHLASVQVPSTRGSSLRRAT